jgi:hypothetical protein
VRGGDGQPWFGDTGAVTDAALTLGSPGLNDATWHVLQACVPHRRIVPAGCEAVMFSGREADGAVEIRAAEIRDAKNQDAKNQDAKNQDAKNQDAKNRANTPRGAVPGPRPAAPVRRQPPALAVPRQGDGSAVARPARQAVEYVWDVEAVDAAGQSLVTWRGLRLRDAGPLPRNAAWPPSLLSVYLERRGVALGLHPDLRVTVECGQPDGAGLAPAPVAVVPQPSPAPDRRPAAPGRGQLEGFSLTVQAPEAAAFSWEAAAGVRGDGPPPGPDLADVANQVRRLLREPPAVISARLRAVAACLSQAGAPPVSSVMADGTADTDWLVLNAAGSTLACTVVEISGVSCPVAIAIMTPDAGRSGFRPPAQPGRRAPRTEGAQAQVPFR